MMKFWFFVLAVSYFALFVWIHNTQLEGGTKISHEEMQMAIRNHAIVTYGEYYE